MFWLFVGEVCFASTLLDKGLGRGWLVINGKSMEFINSYGHKITV